jgi:hypothetical protein
MKPSSESGSFSVRSLLINAAEVAMPTSFQPAHAEELERNGTVAEPLPAGGQDEQFTQVKP